MKRFIGVDLHKANFTVCYLIEKGKDTIREFPLSKLDVFKKTLRPDDEVAVEATFNSRFFCENIVESVSKVVQIDPGQFKQIGKSPCKTDKNDARIIAYNLSIDNLPESRIMNKERARIKSLAGTRDKLVKLRTSLKNKVHSILNANGIHTKKDSLRSKTGLNAVLQHQLDDLYQIELQILVDQIRHLNEGIAKIESQLRKPENQLPGHQNLTSIDGVGDTTASVLLSIIGDINDFPSSKKLCAFFGIVPTVRVSNETIHYGRITKRGSKLGRTMLVQCALSSLRYNTRLEEFYKRVKSRRGHSIAIVATARKLLEFVYFTLSNNYTWDNSNAGSLKSC